MTDLRAVHAEREANGWEELAALVERIPHARWEAEGILPGWSVKDLLWHVAGWLGECAGHLEAMRAGTFEDYDEDDAEVDRRNARFAEEAKRMDAGDVWAGVLDARTAVRQRWDDLPAIDGVAVDWFAGETYRHYREHLPELRRFGG